MQEDKINKIRENIDEIIGDEIEITERKKLLSKMNDYVIYLQQWLLTHNVMSRKNSLDHIWENVYDSLIVCADKKSVIIDEFERENNIVDAGAGGGFPGIPLAIIFPQKRFLLVDINRKKCSFLRSVKSRLVLNNISVINGDIEHVDCARFIVTKAAFSPSHVGVLADALMLGGHLLLWASSDMQEAFAKELKNFGMRLKHAHDYFYGNHPQRSLLLFVKES